MKWEWFVLSFLVMIKLRRTMNWGFLWGSWEDSVIHVALKEGLSPLFIHPERRRSRSGQPETTFLSGLKLLSILRVADSLKLFAWSVARSGKFNLHSIFSGSSGPVLWRLSFPAFHPAERTPDTLRPFFYPNKGPGDLSVGLSIRTLRLSFFSLFQPESLEA